MNRRQTFGGMAMYNNGRNKKNKNQNRHSVAMMNPRPNVLQNNLNMGNANMRRSSLMMNGKKISKDPRSLKDNKWKESEIEKLIEYLCNHGYDSSMLSPKDLNPPSTKHFQYVCSFLFQQIDPSFNMNLKMNKNNKNNVNTFADEVISFFDKLGYPFKINKSSIRCIAPHAWPHLLGAISWLIELLMFAESFDVFENVENIENNETKQEDDADDDDDDDDVNDRLFFNLVLDNYGLWLRGDGDNIDDHITKQLMEPFDDKIGVLNENIASFDTANKQLITEQKRLENECPKISELQNKRQKTINALTEIKKTIEDIDRYMNTIKEKHRIWSNNVHEKMVKISASDDKIGELNAILNKQTISTKEVQRMHHESKSLHSETEELQMQREDVQRKQYDLNENINDLIKKITTNIKTYNDLALKIEIIPQNAKYSFGQNHELKLNDDIDTLLCGIHKITDICNQDIEYFANNLHQLKNHYYDKIRKTESQHKIENDKCAQIQSDLELKENEIEILNQRLSNIVHLYNDEKTKMSLLAANTAKHIEEFELSINSESNDIDQNFKNKRKKYEEICNKYNKLEEECEKIQIQITSKCGIAIKKLLKHRQNTRQILKNINKKVDDALHKVSFYHIQEPTILNIANYEQNDTT